ncbi:MAG: folylpolyglutamate synthase/dihydrofolate synthase family protein [Woeseiaceae bacterium]|nr:folylpolyglutamate synthase/dihydrofolate synthase family protein [Woeseiaceae bacterium]
MRASGSHLDSWLARLETLSPVGINLGLTRIEQMLGRLGLRLPETVFIVGGTNGKGSSVIMLEALLAAGGLRVGSYLSPHVSRYNERIRIEGRDAADDAIIAAFERVEGLRDDVPLTYFEFGTLAALEIFAGQDLDALVLEVGMGGRLDAVNAVEPTASLITNVALDHCEWLGSDVEAIGREKAGILRAGKPGVFADREPPRSVLEHAAAIGAELRVAGRDYDWTASGARWSWQGATRRLEDLPRPALPGSIQLKNAAGALALLEAAGRDELLAPDRVARALGALALPGRMQAVTRQGRFLFDVAHNPAAARVLAAMLGEDPPAGRTVAIIGMLDDKDVDGVAAALGAVVERCVALAPDSPRALPAPELGRRLANVTGRACRIATSIPEALAHARRLAGEDGRILVTGSFYLVGPVADALAAES